MESTPVTFFYPYPEDIKSIELMDPDRDWQFFSTGLRIWIVQTYLRLKYFGFPVKISATIPSRGIVVLHSQKQSINSFNQQIRLNSSGLTVVVVCGDRGKQPWADVQIVQNNLSIHSSSVFYVPHWPQPGLIPRDKTRHTCVKTIAFKGQIDNIHPLFKSSQWYEFLEFMDLEWSIDSTRWKGPNPVNQDTSWNDYSSVDIVLAVRSDFNNLYVHKPATKLLNSWIAGGPALLGPEHAYREQRKSPLDYIEITSLNDAIESIRMLIEKPMLYDAIVKNGFSRSEEFSPVRITEIWAQLLFESIPSLAKRKTFLAKKLLPIKIRRKVSFS